MKKENRGITLVALVITIIILLILSAITISQITGNGILTKAKQASEETKYANAEEKVALAINASYDTNGLNKEKLKDNINKIEGLKEKIEKVEYDLKIIVDGYEFKISELGQITAIGRDKGLPQNTPQTPVGEKVALKEGWGIQTVNYTKTSDGTKVTELETISTVYAISVGGGETIPVPKGFYYVGGNIETGVVISDNADDEYGKGVAEGTDKTTHEYADKLKGNQFVWIPCNINDYTKYDWGYANYSYDTSTNTAEKTQIQKYGGFYVARYEAGTSQIKLKDETKKIGDAVSTSNYMNNIYSMENITTDSKPTSKMNEIPYHYANYTTAVKVSEKMYNTNSVNSGLITGTQWDVMLNYMSDEENKSITNANNGNYYTDLKTVYTWGNFANITLNNCKGKYSIVSNGTTEWTENIQGNNKQSTGVILTTGATEEVKKKNLYDIAGNLWEWTQENGTYYMIRGGSTAADGQVWPACYRAANDDVSNLYYGFRTVLYIK